MRMRWRTRRWIRTPPGWMPRSGSVWPAFTSGSAAPVSRWAGACPPGAWPRAGRRAIRHPSAGPSRRRAAVGVAFAPAAGFSISHSGRWVACAVSGSSKLGLDIERIDASRDIDALAAQAFDADRQAWLTTRPAETRVRDFYNLWSRAEAQFKLDMQAGSVFELSTPELAVVLCCERVLDRPPALELRTLSALPPPACAPAPTRSTPKTSS